MNSEELQRFEDLLERYYLLGYAEGEEGRSTDTPAGDAQRTLAELRALFTGRRLPCICPENAGCTTQCYRNEPREALRSQAGAVPVEARKCLVTRFRPGLGEVTLSVEDYVPEFMDAGNTVFVSSVAPTGEAKKVVMPDGWRIERVGEAIHVIRKDGMYCGYMHNDGSNSPARELTYQFFRDMLAAPPSPAADERGRALQSNRSGSHI